MSLTDREARLIQYMIRNAFRQEDECRGYLHQGEIEALTDIRQKVSVAFPNSKVKLD